MTGDIFVWRKTGETRLAKEGEWFISCGSKRPMRCEIDYTRTAVMIITRRSVNPAWIGHTGNPCEHCGVKADRVPIGPCLAFVKREVLTDKGEAAVDEGRAT